MITVFVEVELSLKNVVDKKRVATTATVAQAHNFAKIRYKNAHFKGVCCLN